MRWVVFILLLFGALFSLTAFAPAVTAKVGLVWPNQSDEVVTLLLAGAAGLFFLTAAVSLVWEAVPKRWWRALVIMAVVTSLALYVVCFAVWMVAPILVDVVLLWGVLAKSWSAGVGRVQTPQSVSARIHPLMNIPVPWVFILTYLVGVGLQYVVPVPVHSGYILLISHVAGIVLMVSGAALAAWSLALFRTAHTTTIPFEQSSNLVTWGPYRSSRNPMYVSLVLIYLGEAGIRAQIWPILVLPLTVAYLHRTVIPVEEVRLREVFGDTYEQFRARVRRWI